MNALNRILSLLLFLVLLAALLALALIPQDFLNWLQLQLGNLVAQVNRLQLTDPTNFNIARAAVAVAALLIFLPLILAEFPRGSEPAVRMSMPGGEAQVTTESVARRLAWHLDQLADVIHVTPQVRGRGDQVDVQLDVETAPEIEVPMKTEEVILVAREIVQERMGLKLGRLDVRIRHSDYPETL
ncbi:MAG: hypothetical protein HUU23_07985 [Caldilineales bacterium]|nr:hypothetical protein [Caldilineales bacterium]